MNWRPVLIALVLTLAACGSPRGKSNATSNDANNPNSSSNTNPNSSSNTNPNSLDGEDIGARLWATICDAAFNCDTVNPELLLVAGRFSSEADCRATGAFPGLDSGQLNASIDAGRIRYDAALAEECFEALDDELCQGGGFEDLPACDDVVTGLIGEGQPCVGSECADGLRCVMTDFQEECSGICQPNCGEQQCTGEQVCSFEDGETCRDRGGDGAACDWDDDCERTLICRDGQCTPGGTVPAGGLCSARQECEGDLLCIQGECGSIEILGQGSTCSPGQDVTAICQAGTVCTDLAVDGEMLVGTCGIPKTQGAECRTTFECAWGLYCTAENPLSIGSCETTLVAGAACTNDQQCQSFSCFDDVCEAGDADEVCTF